MGKEDRVELPLRIDQANPGESAGSETFEDVKNRLSALTPEPVNSAAADYLAASNALSDLTRTLHSRADKLIEHWKGESAQKALDQLGQINWTASELSNKSEVVARNFKWYGTEILAWYKQVGQEMEDGWFSTGGDDEFARKYLTKLYMRTAQSHNNVPEQITKDLPGDGQGNNTPPPGSGGMPGGGGGMPGGGGGMPGGGPGGMPGGGPGSMPGGGGLGTDPGPFSPVSDNRNPHLDPSMATGGSQLAGLDDPGSPAFGTAGGGSGLSSMPGGGAGGMPGGGPGGMPGGGGGGLPSGSPGGFGAAGGMSPGAMGAGGGAGARGAGMRGMPMMPMGGAGAGGGQGGEDRERETWLTEDEDVWGADDDTAPPVIG